MKYLTIESGHDYVQQTVNSALIVVSCSNPLPVANAFKRNILCTDPFLSNLLWFCSARPELMIQINLNLRGGHFREIFSGVV